ncbi:hypothetical protein O181_046253 [Austropuccinia psidii MF-1]|uniref:Uncharacterized protein n=1 Tax=Austropuccinia psidii MF-1 TaxID=1389203 RepID=A0A9Q3DRW8_9BASI|nr:hypothetical protein [Austropuccinia psidii MF-1]
MAKNGFGAILDHSYQCWSRPSPWPILKVFGSYSLQAVDVTGSRQRDVARWTNFGGSIQAGGRPISSNSEVPISRINNEGVVKRIRQIDNSPPNPDDEGSDELDDEEV